MSKELQATVADAIQSLFGVRVSFDPERLSAMGAERGTSVPQRNARRISLGTDLPPLYICSEDLQMFAYIRRFAIREVETQKRLQEAEQRLAELKGKTSRLIPGGLEESASLGHWSIESADMSLLERYPKWAVSLEGRPVRVHQLDLQDLETTLRVLERERERSVPVRNGELYGYRAGHIAIVILTPEPLKAVDRELVALQATWLHRMVVEQENLWQLDDLSSAVRERNSELQQALITAEQAVAAKATFLAHMSHELRTPLNGIVGLAQVLEDTELNEDQRELVGMQLESARWLREIINAVLDISKLEAGSMQAERIPFDLPELVRGAARGVHALACEKDLVLEFSIDKDVPVHVEGDPSRIRQALLNLLSNAIKFTEQGEIHLQVGGRDDRIRFTVVDTGIGIPKERRDSIFEPFVQADVSTTRRFGGTGLGLPLVKQFAQLHDGEAGVHGRSDGRAGSVFWFTARLPKTAGLAKDRAKVTEREPQKLRVLVVEDQPVNQLIVQRMLEQRGHQVELASDGVEAVKKVEENEPYHMVFMDCMMPVMDGFEATKQIRKKHDKSAIPIVALTASSMEEDIEHCLQSGMNGVLSKPVRREDMVRALNEHAR